MEKSEHQGAINLSAVRESTESLQNGDVLRNGENTEESQVHRNAIKWKQIHNYNETLGMITVVTSYC